MWWQGHNELIISPISPLFHVFVEFSYLTLFQASAEFSGIGGVDTFVQDSVAEEPEPEQGMWIRMKNKLIDSPPPYKLIMTHAIFQPVIEIGKNLSKI